MFVAQVSEAKENDTVNNKFYEAGAGCSKDD